MPSETIFSFFMDKPLEKSQNRSEGILIGLRFNLLPVRIRQPRNDPEHKRTDEKAHGYFRISLGQISGRN